MIYLYIVLGLLALYFAYSFGCSVGHQEGYTTGYVAKCNQIADGVPERLKKINRYLIIEGFSKKHIDAIAGIIYMFNYSKELETEIFKFSKRISNKCYDIKPNPPEQTDGELTKEEN